MRTLSAASLSDRRHAGIWLFSGGLSKREYLEFYRLGPHAPSHDDRRSRIT